MLDLRIFKPLHFIIPEGCEVEVQLSQAGLDAHIDITKSYVATPSQVWDHFEESRINIVCFESFIEHEATIRSTSVICSIR